MLLAFVNLIFRRRIVIRPRLHFDKNQRAAIARNDVEFPKLTAKIANDDPIPEIAQMLGGQIFPIAHGIHRRLGFEQRLKPISYHVA